MIHLSVVLPVRNEEANLALLLPRLRTVLDNMKLDYEILVIDGHSTDGSVTTARQYGAVAVSQEGEGYGPALAQGFQKARGDYILTLDSDLSHEPDFIYKLWLNRNRADVIVASRYCTGGAAYAPLIRRTLSRLLNFSFRWGLAIPIRDLSSGFRLYRTPVVKRMNLKSKSFEVLEEILIGAYTQGWCVIEAPLAYFPRQHGRSNAKIFRFGLRLLVTFFDMWSLRNSVDSADYDERAFYSRIPLQRYWHRTRHRIIMNLTRGRGRTLDIGCGSSVTTLSLNRGVGVDNKFEKLRYMARYGLVLVNATATALPFVAESFDCVVCSQVLPFLSCPEEALREVLRVLKPGGLLVVGISDHSKIGWRMIEPLYRFAAPRGYAKDVQVRWTRRDLQDICRELGLVTGEEHYVLGSELIASFLKSVSH